MPTVSTFTKTIGTSTVAPVALPTASILYSASIDVATKLGITFFPRIGRTSATALAAEILLVIEGSASGSGDDAWFPIFQITTATCKTAAASTTVAAGLPVTAGDSVINVTLATNITAGDVLYIANAVVANAEFVRVKSVTALAVTLAGPTTRSHAAGVAVTDLGEILTPIYVDTSTFSRIRFRFDTAATVTTTAVDVSCTHNTLDSVLNT